MTTEARRNRNRNRSRSRSSKTRPSTPFERRWIVRAWGTTTTSWPMTLMNATRGVRLLLIRERDAEFAADRSFKSRSLTDLNNEAVRHLKSGDDVRCIVSYAKLFRKIAENNVTHPTLFVCHANRAVAYLNLGLFEEALWDGHRAQTLANERFTQTQSDDGTVKTFVKGYARKGFALMGLKEPRLAKMEFERGLSMSPNDLELKRGLEESTEAIIRDLYHECVKNDNTLYRSSGTTSERISQLPFSAPLHRVHPRDMLPNKLLTPFQAENDYHLKDTYNYMTIQTDIRIPKRHFKVLRRRSSSIKIRVGDTESRRQIARRRERCKSFKHRMRRWTQRHVCFEVRCASATRRGVGCISQWRVKRTC